MQRKRTIIEIIPHECHRYETVGDFWIDKKGVKQFRVSETGNDDMNFLVALHEFVEAHLTRRKGISDDEITAFDIMFEEERRKGLHKDDEEPGFDPRAPYFQMHIFATAIEMAAASKMELNWTEYEEILMSL
jgi:hypothetical protein